MVKEINVVVEVHNMRYRVLSLYKSLSDEQRLRKLAIAMKWKMEFRQVPPLFAISRPLPNKDSTKAPFFYIAGVQGSIKTIYINIRRRSRLPEAISGRGCLQFRTPCVFE